MCRESFLGKALQGVFGIAGFSVDVMTAGYSLHLPTMFVEESCEIFSLPEPVDSVRIEPRISAHQSDLFHLRLGHQESVK